MNFKSFLRKAVGDFRHNKAAAFAHGVQVLATAILGGVAGLSILAYFGLIQPFQVLQAAGYAVILFVMDYAIASDLALGLRFIAPDLFSFLSLSTVVSGITAIGSLSIAWRWHRSQ